MNCGKCEKPISNQPELIPVFRIPENAIKFSGKLFHPECFNGYIHNTDLQKNPKINLGNLEVRASEIFECVRNMPCNSFRKKLIFTLAEHDNSYGVCKNCGDILQKCDAVTQGKTYELQRQRNLKVRNVKLFCTEKCDTQYVSKFKLTAERILNNLQLEYKNVEASAEKEIDNYQSTTYFQTLPVEKREQDLKQFSARVQIQTNIKKKILEKGFRGQLAEEINNFFD